MFFDKKSPNVSDDFFALVMGIHIREYGRFTFIILNINHFFKKTTKKPPTKFIDNYLYYNKLDKIFIFL